MPEYCVTGGTGFIGGFLVKALLEKGHAVRTTVRDPDKVDFLWNLEGAKERLKILKADLLDEGSFDEALEGVDGVFHTASPVPLTPTDDDDVQTKLIDPAVEGTRNVLASCVKAATSLKRIVLTSSVSAIRHPDPNHPIHPAADSLNESHWTDIEYCKKQKLWYAYSKTVAEQEAWKIAKENDLDLVVVNPSLVIGPLLAPQPTSTLLYTLNIIKGTTRAGYPDTRVGFVHVDDVVSAHILAMEGRKANGRLICSGPMTHWAQVIDMLRDKYPMHPYESKCSCLLSDPNPPMSLDTSKIIQLGFPGFKSIPEMFEDFIQSFQSKGFL